MNLLFASDDQNTGVSASVLPVIIQGSFPLILTGLISLSLSLSLSLYIYIYICIYKRIFCAKVDHSSLQCVLGFEVFFFHLNIYHEQLSIRLLF